MWHHVAHQETGITIRVAFPRWNLMREKCCVFQSDTKVTFLVQSSSSSPLVWLWFILRAEAKVTTWPQTGVHLFAKWFPTTRCYWTRHTGPLSSESTLNKLSLTCSLTHGIIETRHKWAETHQNRLGFGVCEFSSTEWDVKKFLVLSETPLYLFLGRRSTPHLSLP